jgi:uncharacterized protein (DUF58 family)
VITKDAASSSGSLIDPRTLMAIRNLELRARTVVEGFWKGLHRSPYHGFSVEFSEYRPYSHGDDPRYLDWQVYARSDRYYVKKFEEETNLRCYLLADNSHSMNYGSLAYTKAAYANTLAATLAYFLHGQADAVGLLTFDEDVRQYLPARYRVGHLRRLMIALEQPAQGRSTNLEKPLGRMLELVRKRGLIVLISDMLGPVAPLERELGALCATGHEVLIFHILDPAEVNFTFNQAALFEDAESGSLLYIDPALARREYLRNLEAHCGAVQATCRKLGVAYHRFGTDRPMELALFDFLRARAARGKRVQRLRTTGARHAG